MKHAIRGVEVSIPMTCGVTLEGRLKTFDAHGANKKSINSVFRGVEAKAVLKV